MRWSINRWKRWFAWYPVRVGDDIVWLEWIERKVDSRMGIYWSEYRNPQRSVK